MGKRRFLAAMAGEKGVEVTRLGSEGSGIRAQAQGWNAGVTINGYPQDLDRTRDFFVVSLNGGSNGEVDDYFTLGELRETPAGRIFVLSDAAADALGSEQTTIRL